MSKFCHCICEVRRRWLYPVSLPEDIGEALGINIPPSITYQRLMEVLTDPQNCPHRLARYMPRELAEAAFSKALRKESFNHESVFSYYFREGWLEFVLLFDVDSCLRRVYLQHPALQEEDGWEIPLSRRTRT
ncbi:MAG: hypothetical protein ACQEP8_04800 [Chlamydiota bacterium]